MVKEVSTPGVIYPCKASGLDPDKTTYFLDQVPKIDEKATLIGCELSGLDLTTPCTKRRSNGWTSALRTGS